MIQKKIALAQAPDMVAAAIQIIQDCSGVSRLVGDSEFETVVNAATLDAQQTLLIKFMNSIENIKSGGLLTTESP